MESKHFSIELHSDQLVYYPSQDITGVVAIELEEGSDGKDLIIKFIGKSQCRFKGRTGKHGRGHDAHTQIYTREHIIVEHEKNVPDPAAGKHQLEFSFNLPSHLPSSVEAPLGNIRYVLSAHIGDSVVAKSIIINEIIDANTEENRVGTSTESSQNISCLCVVNGLIDAKGSLSRMCYCPGEAILVSVNITNSTSRTTNALTAKLFQTIKYNTKKRTKNMSTVIATLKGPKIKKGSSYVWEDQPIGIPAIVPTVSNDVVVEVEYYVQVDIGVTMGGNISIKMPVIIGTIPYQQEKRFEKYGTTENPQTTPLSNVVSGPPPDFSIFGYTDMPPLSYSTPLELGRGRNNVSFEGDKDVDSDLKYCPIYTFVKTQRVNAAERSGKKVGDTAEVKDTEAADTAKVKDTEAGDTEEVKETKSSEGDGSESTEGEKGNGTVITEDEKHATEMTQKNE